MEQVLTTIADYWEIEELIYKEYNLHYEIISEEGCNNNSYLEYDITGVLREDDETLLRCVFDEEFDLKTPVNWYNPKTLVIMNDLCRREVIKPGKYIIKVDY